MGEGTTGDGIVTDFGPATLARRTSDGGRLVAVGGAQRRVPAFPDPIGRARVGYVVLRVSSAGRRGLLLVGRREAVRLCHRVMADSARPARVDFEAWALAALGWDWDALLDYLAEHELWQVIRVRSAAWAR